MGLTADTHLHVEDDFWEYNYFQEHGHRPSREHKFVPVDVVQEELKRKELDGAVILCHSSYENYKKDYDMISDFYKNETNLIPGVEVNSELTTAFDYYGKIHVTYLGKIPVQDWEYGSWFSHSTTTKGIFEKFYHYYEKDEERKSIQYVLNNPDLMKKYKVKLVETTKRNNLRDVLLLHEIGLTTLHGTDAHPDERNNFDNVLGRQGIIIPGSTFNYDTFMYSLKNNYVDYFHKEGNDLYYTESEEDKMIIKKE